LETANIKILGLDIDCVNLRAESYCGKLEYILIAILIATNFLVYCKSKRTAESPIFDMAHLMRTLCEGGI